MPRKDLKPPSLLLRFAITGSLMAVLLVGFEFYLRSLKTYITQQDSSTSFESDPRFLYEYTPSGRRLLPNTEAVINNHYLSKRDIHISTNSFGFRDQPLEPAKKPAEYRVLVLGDSITIAEYVPAEETYVEVLENALQTKFPNLEIEAINAGVGDIGTKEEIDILEENGIKLSPDIVILSFYLNDSRPSWGFPAESRHRGWLRRHSILVETIYHTLKLNSWIKEQGGDRFAWIPASESTDWANSPQTFQKLVELAQYDWGAAWQDASWTILSEQFDRLLILSQRYNFKVAIIAFPVRFQVETSFLDRTPQDRLERISTSMNFEYLDLLPVLRDAQDKQELFYDQCHLTTFGLKVSGEAAASFIANVIGKNSAN